MFSATTLAALVSVATTALAQEGGATASSVAQLVANLRTAPTENDRLALLDNEDLLFDFNGRTEGAGVTVGAAGRTVAASSANFPYVTGHGVSMTIGYLGPCGMNSPHTHPRASEINFSINTTLRAGVLVENGARFAEIDIRPGTATVFPQGAIHFEMNPSCEEAMFVAGFNGEDPGVQQVAQRFFGLPPDIVGATLGGLGIQEVANLEAFIPDNVIFGVEECLARCGIERTAQDTAQRQPRVATNAFPKDIEAVNVYDLIVEEGETGAAEPAAEGEGEAEAEEGEQEEEETEEGQGEETEEGQGEETEEGQGEETEEGQGEETEEGQGEETEEEGEAEEPAGEGEQEEGEAAETEGKYTVVVSVLGAEPTAAA